MKCPYQTRTIHIPEYTEGYYKQMDEDRIMFGDCVKELCPYYESTYYEATKKTYETCRKVESEVNK